jgi:hypothetical protein
VHFPRLGMFPKEGHISQGRAHFPRQPSVQHISMYILGTILKEDLHANRDIFERVLFTNSKTILCRFLWNDFLDFYKYRFINCCNK